MLFYTPARKQEPAYKKWDHEDFKFAKLIEGKEEYSEEEDDYEEIRQRSGVYAVEVKKNSSKIYRIKGTDIYMMFRYSFYMYSGDEGVIECDGYSGYNNIFYLKP